VKKHTVTSIFYKLVVMLWNHPKEK